MGQAVGETDRPTCTLHGGLALQSLGPRKEGGWGQSLGPCEEGGWGQSLGPCEEGGWGRLARVLRESVRALLGAGGRRSGRTCTNPSDCTEHTASSSSSLCWYDGRMDGLLEPVSLK